MITDNYLDISKSVMISSPAGSGKTEKLSRRYIALLQSGSEVERILAITFTEKAAAEMKERIVNILRREDPEMFVSVREKMPRMRISTIHAFCLKLLKRFCIELGIDPSLEVMDAFNAEILWNEAIYETLLEDGKSEDRLFYHTIKEGGIKGWNKLYKLMNALHSLRPSIELGLCRSSAGSYDFNLYDSSGDGDYFQKAVTIYQRCLNAYGKKKMARHLLDYNDLELLAYDAISRNPEWHNVLYSFDEHTDHILVDEFQDTSSLQWRIIDKLTEEWRSGQGAKKDKGASPTIFLVGDDKQSIYSFRGANVAIFRNAKEKLAQWLAEEYHFIEIKENYRSLPAIVDFVNTLFERLMPKGLYDDYRIEYSSFEATRKGEGRAELTVFDSVGNTKDNRKAEAAALARKIQDFKGTFEVYQDGKRRPCSYGDMAILLKNRTHLAVFEDALSIANIPFVVVKGVGFYTTPEVEILKSILFFLIDPSDNYALFNVLRSPLFSLGYEDLFEIMQKSAGKKPGFLCKVFLDELQLKESNKQSGLFDDMGGDDLSKRMRAISASLNEWLALAQDIPYSAAIEKILSKSGGWRYLHEKQRHVNAKKFIQLVESFEINGASGLEIREKLIKASAKSDEAKANINTEGMDAVKIMTIHASKGLQFPMVFLPCLDEDGSKQSGSIVLDEDVEKGIILAYEDESKKRNDMPMFRRFKERAADEEKRLFYVAVTRAMDYLCMSGALKDSLTGKLAYLNDAGFEVRNSAFHNNLHIEKITVDYRAQGRQDGRKAMRQENVKPDNYNFNGIAVYTEPVDYSPLVDWQDVTEEIAEVNTKHGDDWISIGRAFHRIFEGISKGYINDDNIEMRIMDILKNEVLHDSRALQMRDVILSDMQRLKQSGYFDDIISPRSGSYSELPFVFESGGMMYRGRIDRLIVEEGSVTIYDYKTYPVSDEEIPELSKKYSFQMDIYRMAAEKIFNLPVKGYIFFTHELKLFPAW
jgi:ATP-dependent helicase/nuclease subunit A